MIPLDVIGMVDNLYALLYSNDLIRRIMSNLPISLLEFNIVTNYLVYNNIPFDVSFDGATRKLAPAIELTIHINPSRTEVLVVSLSPGANAYTENP